MPNECSPEVADRVVTFTGTPKREEGGAVARQSPTVGRGGSRAALYLAHINARPQETMPASAPEGRENSIWSSVVNFFVEGFANCATLYPTVHFSPGGLLLEADVPVREAFKPNERRLSLVSNTVPKAAADTSVGNGLAVAPQIFLDGSHLYPQALSNRTHVDESLDDPVAIEGPSRWNLLSSCWEVVVTLHAHMRRERDIRVAVEALAELDDGMLKDIGIRHRSHIEYAVRNGNGC